MLKKKKIREKSKLKPSLHLRKFKEGELVIIKRVPGSNLRTQLHGVNAKVLGKQGKAYVVGFLNGNKYKTLVLKPIYLKSQHQKQK